MGWFQGRSEFGPRALGFRSILCNAKLEGMKDALNKKIKFREKYRPFAPAILFENANRLDCNIEFSPYMTKAFDVSSEARTFRETMHNDGSARIQTVDSDSTPYLYNLLKEVERISGEIACLINTSFNLAGEPIVEKPEDALRTFVSCDLDLLFIGNCIVRK